MIKISPYFNLPQKDEIFNLYLYLAANAMPFYPEDIFYEGFFFPDGKTKRDIACYNRQPRRRTENYKNVLNNYRITDGNTEKEKRIADALLAEKIIDKSSKRLHDFLYSGMIGGHINPDKLRTLLTTSVGHDALQKFSFLPITLKEKQSKDLLEHVFRYEVFSKQKGIYRLIMLMGVEVCPYCNRLFITTVAEKGKLIRPQLDHYRSKSEYPFLALSIMNLVPSCGVCNHTKGNDSREILYPYEDEMGNHCSFRIEAKSDITVLTGNRFDDKELTIQLVQNDTVALLGKRIKESIDLLNLSELYQSHKGYVSDLLLQRYVFTDEMIKDIAESLPGLFKNETEVKEMLIMGKLDQEHWGTRPLGKLTHDISKQLDELYKK